MGCKSAVALVRGVEYWRSKGCSTAQVLHGVFWNGLACFQLLQNGFRWPCYPLTFSCSNSMKNGSVVSPWYSSFNMEELPFKHNEEAVSTKFSTLCITANNRGPFDVERV